MRQITVLNKGWKFRKKQGDSFMPINLPHTWNAADGQDGGNDYYRGECTYQTNLPDPKPGCRQYIEFEGVNHIARVFCNEQWVGEHRGGFSTFRFEITEYMQETDNSITVLADNTAPEVYPQRADFTFFGGIYRAVSFIEVDAAHFDLMKSGSQGVFVTPQASGETRIDAFLENALGCVLKVQIFEYNQNRLVASGETIVSGENAGQASILCKVQCPHLWNGCRDPFLYQVRATLQRSGQICDEVDVIYGYRTFSVDSEKGFYLNGESYPLHGVSRHQDRQDKGWAISGEDQEEDMRMIEEIGANTIRLAHYQHSQKFYQLCDKSGMIVWAEIPLISSFMNSDAAKANTVSQMTELILQNYNHPSICFWGISNEISLTGENEALFENLRELEALSKKLDPSRLTTMAHLGTVKPGTPHTAITDVQGFNLYYGWYVGAVTDNGAILDELHKQMPGRPFCLSEYGADTVLEWHSSTPENHDYTEEYQAYYHEEMLKTFAPRPYLWGTYVWNMFDFASDGRDEGGVKGINSKGLVTYDRRIKKDAFYIYQAYWTGKPMVHLCGRRFTERRSEQRDIKVYTNEKEVKLFINGHQAGTAQAGNHVCIFSNVALGEGENEITVQTESGIMDTMKLIAVPNANPGYVLPPDEIVGGNWFDEETGEPMTLEYPEGYFSINDTIGDMMNQPEALAVLQELLGVLREKEGDNVPAERQGSGDLMLQNLRTMVLKRMLKFAGSTLSPGDVVKYNRMFNKVPKG